MAAYLDPPHLAYGVVTVLGVLFLLFVLFFAVTDPDDIARKAVGERARPEVYAQWKKNHGYDRPLVPQPHAWPPAPRATRTRCCSSTSAACSPSISAAAMPTTAPIAKRLREGAGPQPQPDRAAVPAWPRGRRGGRACSWRSSARPTSTAPCSCCAC